MASLDKVDDVVIDVGDFKYILIQVKKKGEENISKFIVRGFKRSPYHADVLAETEKENGMSDFSLEVHGGGRINHDEKKKEIVLYSESMQYGPADHHKSAEIIKKMYKGYKVTVS